jgi:hypothetical protein
MTTINKFLIQAAIALMTAAGPMAAAEVVPPSNSDRSDTEHLLADTSNDINDIEEIEEDAKDDDWRVNLDVYGLSSAIRRYDNNTQRKFKYIKLGFRRYF